MGLIHQPEQSFLEAACLLDVLEHWDELKCSIKIKDFKLGFWVAKVLLLVHPVVLQLLMSVQIRDSPDSLIGHGLLISVASLLSKLLRHILLLDIQLQWR